MSSVCLGAPATHNILLPVRLKTLYFSHWLSAPGESELCIAGQNKCFYSCHCHSFDPSPCSRSGGLELLAPFWRVQDHATWFKPAGPDPELSETSGKIAVAAAPGWCWHPLLVKLMARLLWAAWALSAASERARSSKLLSKERWSYVSKSHYAVFHTAFFLKKKFQYKQLVLIIILPITLNQQTCNTCCCWCQLAFLSNYSVRGVFLYNNFILTSLSLEIFLLRWWHTTQTSPEILVRRLRLVFQSGMWLHGKQPFSFSTTTYIAEAALWLGFHYCRSITVTSYFSNLLSSSSSSPTSLIATFTSISAGQTIPMCQEQSTQRTLHRGS